MRVGRDPRRQQGALHAGCDLRGDVARALISDGELATLHALAHNVLKQIEMGTGEAKQGRLHSRGDCPEH